jgi:spermidine/putrescine transport system ATP-binding protein
VPPAPAVKISQVTRRFGEVEALRDISLAVQRGEFFSLLGPSGCGKTTLLRIIAGLDFPDAGSVRLGDADALDIPAHLRPVNTVFQSYALFPHLDVHGNVAFGLRMKKVPRDELERRVQEALELVRISALSRRSPAELSGGEKQRVALARALVNEPQVLLLDEPLAALDLKLRKELQQELRALQRRTGITFIYVTHDQDEALSMSDRIAVMDHGQVVQLGTGEELYERPRTRFVAQFLGGCNLLPATVHQRSGDRVRVTTPVGPLELNAPGSRSEFTLAIRPEKILPGRNGSPNQVRGVVLDTTYTGAETQSLIGIGTATLRVVSINGPASARSSKGDSIELTLPEESLVMLED